MCNVCCVCNKSKEVEEFTRNGKVWKTCNECSEKAKSAYQSNPEKFRARASLYSATHRDKVRAYYADNHEEIIAKQRERYEANKEELQKYQREYYYAHKEEIRAKQKGRLQQEKNRVQALEEELAKLRAVAERVA